jgi:diacylglycerol kinase
MGLRHSTTKSFKYAFDGIKTAYKNEPNLRIHTIFAFLAISTAGILGISTIEWLLLTFTIFYVITFELLNTVLEALVNLVSPEISPHAKIAKDVSAACVLLAATMSVIVGLSIFLPKIIYLLDK